MARRARALAPRRGARVRSRVDVRPSGVADASRRPWFGAIPTLTAAAFATEHIRLGPLVASPNFRHPVPFAKELISLDDISGGRLTFGIGSGGVGWDATVLGQEAWSPRERADRFAEFVDLTDRLLREPETSYAGRFYSADDARTYPGCVQQPRIPFAVAATGPRAMKLAATYADTWVTTGDRDAEAALRERAKAPHVVRAADGHARRSVRARSAAIPASLDRLVLTGISLDSGLASAGAFDETLGRYAAIGVTDFVVHWPRPSDPFAGDATAFERIVSRLAHVGSPSCPTSTHSIVTRGTPTSTGNRTRGPHRQLTDAQADAVRRARIRRASRTRSIPRRLEQRHGRDRRVRDRARDVPPHAGRRPHLHRRGRRDHVHDAPRRPLPSDSASSRPATCSSTSAPT